MDRHVAVKLYTAGVASTEHPPHRAEVAALAKLRHSGLVTLYDAGVDLDRAYIVMQLIDGETLGQRLKREPLRVAEVAAIGSQLANTLSYVHESGVVHRDIKPSNVLLDGANRPFLADFGVSRLVDATRSTTTGFVLGTPAFLAPEQVRGQRVGPAADIYALGLVLLEAATGKREYPGGAVESAVARLHRPPEFPAHLPEHLRSLLEVMTADDPAARPDAADVASQLEATPIPDASHPPRAVAITRSSRGLRRRLGPVLAVVTASVLGGVVLLSGQPEATQPRAPVIAEQPNSTSESVTPAIAASPPIADPDRRPEQAITPPATSEAVKRADVQNLPAEGPPMPREQIGAATAPPSKNQSADAAESESGEDATSNGIGKGKSNKNGEGKGSGKGNGNGQNKDRKSKE